MFDRLFGRKTDSSPPSMLSPLGLRLGGAVRFDPLLAATLGKDGRLLEFPTPHTPLRVEAQGTIELGEGVALHRFYLDDDWWLQAKVSGTLGEDGESGIDEIVLFGFGDVATPSTQTEFDELARPIGLAVYRYADAEFKRLWGSGPGPVATSDYRERVRTRAGETYEVRHQDMLHAREIAGSCRGELLLVSAETDEEGAVTLVHSVGMPLLRPDLEIT